LIVIEFRSVRLSSARDLKGLRHMCLRVLNRNQRCHSWSGLFDQIQMFCELSIFPVCGTVRRTRFDLCPVGFSQQTLICIAPPSHAQPLVQLLHLNLSGKLVSSAGLSAPLSGLAAVISAVIQRVQANNPRLKHLHCVCCAVNCQAVKLFVWMLFNSITCVIALCLLHPCPRVCCASFTRYNFP
jgi:hypothetical protein